jgi:hypothetical protein
MKTFYVLVYYYQDEPHELDASPDRGKLERKAKQLDNILKCYGWLSAIRYHEVQEVER